MRINLNSCALKHLLEHLREDVLGVGELEVLHRYKIVNKTDYQIAQSILKRVNGQPCGFFMVDLSNNELRRLTKLLFDLYDEQLEEFSGIVQQVKTQEEEGRIKGIKNALEMISDSINTIIPDWQDRNREIIEGQFQLWTAGKVVPPQRYKCACCNEPICYYEHYDEMQKIKKRLKKLRTKENRTPKEKEEMARLKVLYKELNLQRDVMIEEMESGLRNKLK